MNGWRYSVTIPSWTQTEVEDVESVVFYRIEVSIMPPEHHGAPCKRSVLRRFSHFQKLHRMLKEEFAGKEQALAADLAPRWTPFNVRKPEAVEKRRRELEAWLWRLISEPGVARSRVLNQFLELADAARMVNRSPQPAAGASGARLPQHASHPVSPLRMAGLTSASTAGATELDALSDFDDTASDSSFFAQGSSTVSAEPQQHREPWLSHSGASSSRDFAAHDADSPSYAAAAATGGAAASLATGQVGSGELRLGLRVEHRGNIRRLVKSLQERLHTASNDLQDAVERMRTDAETKRELYERIRTLEAQLEAQRAQQACSPPRVPPGNDADLSAQLAAQQQRNLDLQKALQDESGRNIELQAQIAALANGIAQSQQQLQQSRSGTLDNVSMSPVSPSDKRDTDASTLEAELQAAKAEAQAAQAATAELQAAKAEAQAAQQQLAEAEARNRANQKLLAKEVKSLRKQLQEAQQAAAAAASSTPAPAPDSGAPSDSRTAADAAERPAADAAAAETAADRDSHTGAHAGQPLPGAGAQSYRTLLLEVQALQRRLADCAVDQMLASVEAESPGGSAFAAQQQHLPDATAGEELLQTSDGRIQALAAEAAFLADDPGTWSNDEKHIRQAFAAILQENAQLHKSVNAALRSQQHDLPMQVLSRSENGGSHSMFGRFGAGRNADKGRDSSAADQHDTSAAGAGGSNAFDSFKTRFSRGFRSNSASSDQPSSI